MSLAQEMARELIAKNRKAQKLYVDAGQLRVSPDRVQAFMLQSVQSIGALAPDLLSYFELLYGLVRSTDSYPYSAEYPVNTPSGLILLDSYGNALGPPTRENEVEASSILDKGLESAPDSELILDGLDSVEAKPLSALFEAFIAKRVNKLSCAAFASSPEYLDETWHIPVLRSFYANEGSPRWIPPIEDIISIESALRAKANAQGFREQILRSMADSGRMGFCPTQYLRRVIVPLFERLKDDFTEFERQTSLLADCFLTVSAEMGPEGDGSASNLFTLKTLIRPLSDPSSRLFLPGYKDDPAMPALEDILYTIGRHWAQLFRKRYPATRELLRFYGEVFFEGIVRVETPREILIQSQRLLEHIEFIASRIQAESDFQKFRKPLHTRGVRILLRRAEKNSHYAPLLRTLLKHFDTVERLVKEAEARSTRERKPGVFPASPFASTEYLRYMRFFASGAFKNPSDVDAFFDVLRGLSSVRDTDADEMVRLVLTTAKEPVERELLISFLKACPVFDELIYGAWRSLDEPGRLKLIAEIKRLSREYLVNPRISLSIKGFDGIEERLEAAIIKQLVQSTQLTKVRIDEILKGKSVSGIDMVSEELAAPRCFRVAEKRAHSIEGEESTMRRNTHYEFIKSRAELLRGLADSVADPDYALELARKLATEAVAQSRGMEALRAQTEAQIASLQPEASQLRASLEKKLKGLLEQGLILEQFSHLVEPMLDAETPSEQGLFAALLALLCDKGFSKKHSDAFLLLALSLQVNEEHAERLAEEPFSVISEIDPRAQAFSFDEVAALKEASTTLVRRAISEFFVGPFRTIPPALQAGLRALIALAAGTKSAEEDAVAADILYRRYGAFAANHFFDQELDSLEREESGERGIRDILMVAGKRKIDQFYGYVGELCIAQHVQEIRRKDFTPIRIVDETRGRLVGYVHLLIFSGQVAGEQSRIALLGGIEPKSSWLAYIDEVDFYLKVKDAIIDWAKAMNCRCVCMTTNVVAISNCNALAATARIDMEGKPAIEPVSTICFPAGYWNLSPMSVLWMRARR